MMSLSAFKGENGGIIELALCSRKGSNGCEEPALLELQGGEWQLDHSRTP